MATRPQTRTVRVPGQCYVYTQTFSIGWVPMGSPMNTFRSGSSITRMGRFLVAMGGRGRSAREAIQ